MPFEPLDVKQAENLAPFVHAGLLLLGELGEAAHLLADDSLHEPLAGMRVAANVLLLLSASHRLLSFGLVNPKLADLIFPCRAKASQLTSQSS